MNRDARKNVDYNSFAKNFSDSRINMKWEEIDYFLSFLEWKKDFSILDVWCWNWRFLAHIKDKEITYNDYLWVDLSEWLLEQASELNPESRFLHLNMLDLEKIRDTFDYIFFIASFHHLNSIEDRIEVFKKTYNLLNPGWIIFITNWALDSEVNIQKYNKDKIPWSENKFWSTDYNIKFWEHDRFYHCFSLEELKYLWEEVWFKIIENKLFDTGKNYITILKKA